MTRLNPASARRAEHPDRADPGDCHDERADEQKKHEDFVNRMVEKGYTHRQVRLLCEWYLRVRKSS